jgi:hypothetical protein
MIPRPAYARTCVHRIAISARVAGGMPRNYPSPVTSRIGGRKSCWAIVVAGAMSGWRLRPARVCAIFPRAACGREGRRSGRRGRGRSGCTHESWPRWKNAQRWSETERARGIPYITRTWPRIRRWPRRRLPWGRTEKKSVAALDRKKTRTHTRATGRKVEAPHLEDAFRPLAPTTYLRPPSGLLRRTSFLSLDRRRFQDGRRIRGRQRERERERESLRVGGSFLRCVRRIRNTSRPFSTRLTVRLPAPFYSVPLCF